jgi:hypothetical protein
MIVSTVNALVVKTPAALAKDDSHSIVSAQYLANDGQFHSFASLTPTMEIKDGNISISFTTLEQEKNQWQNYNNQSTSSFANFFDFAGQFNLLNNLGLLQNEMTKDASDSFGVNRFYDYQLQNRVLDTKTDYLPYYYVKMPKSFGSLGKFELNEESVENLFLKYFQLMSDQTIVMIGRSQVDTSSLISSVLPRNFYVAKGNNG